MHQSVRDAFIAFNTPLEARIRFMYLDVRRLVTTGIGNLIDADDPNHFGTNAHLLPFAHGLGWFDKNDGTQTPVSAGEINTEYTTVKFSGTAGQPISVREAITRLRITDATIDQLVNNQMSQFEATLRGRSDFSGLDNWPADAQLGLLSMAWAMGPNFHFPNFQAHAAAADWRGMAAECHISDTGNPGVRPRNVRNELLFMIASWVVAPPPGDFSLLVYDPTIDLAANMRSRTFQMPINLAIGVQTALETLAVQLGKPAYNPNGLDGVIGGGTRNALVAFQSDKGLPTTPGVNTVGDIPGDTIDALTNALDAIAPNLWWR